MSVGVWTVVGTVLKEFCGARSVSERVSERVSVKVRSSKRSKALLCLCVAKERLDGDY